MAGSAIISGSNVWTVGLHAFRPIVERIREKYGGSLTVNERRIFEPLDEGFDFIACENLTEEEFRRFMEVVRSVRIGPWQGGDDWTSRLAGCIDALLEALRSDARATWAKEE